MNYRGFEIVYDIPSARWWASPGTLSLGPYARGIEAQEAIDRHLLTVAEMDKVHEVPLDDDDLDLIICALTCAPSDLLDRVACDELIERLGEVRGG